MCVNCVFASLQFLSTEIFFVFQQYNIFFVSPIHLLPSSFGDSSVDSTVVVSTSSIAVSSSFFLIVVAGSSFRGGGAVDDAADRIEESPDATDVMSNDREPDCLNFSSPAYLPPPDENSSLKWVLHSNRSPEVE